MPESNHEMLTMTIEEWNKRGTELFGPDKMNWKFVCPVCKHVAKVSDWRDAGAPETAAFSCVGRWLGSARAAFGGKVGKGKGPCNYAGGGLFRLNPVSVDGHQIFAFADATC